MEGVWHDSEEKIISSRIIRSLCDHPSGELATNRRSKNHIKMHKK